MEIPVWVIVFTALLAFREVIAITVNLAMAREAIAMSSAWDLMFHLPIYAFCWGWI